MFFSCAPQTVQIGDVSLRLEVDQADTSRCIIWLEGHKAVFQRNGPLLVVEAPKEEHDEEPLPVREEPAAGDVAASEGDAQQVPVSGGAPPEGRVSE